MSWQDVHRLALLVCGALLVACAVPAAKWERSPGAGRHSLRYLATQRVASPARSASTASLVGDARSTTSAPANVRPEIPVPRPLSADEIERIGQGWTVARSFEFEHQGRTYFGGIAYQAMQADMAMIVDTLVDVEQWPDALPLTHSARLLESDDQGMTVELVQGNTIFQAHYAVRLQPVAAGTVKFWLDKGQPHDIEDAWGYFKVDSMDAHHSLLTVGIALDLGSSWVRSLLAERVRRAALAAPAHVRRYLEPRALAFAAE